MRTAGIENLFGSFDLVGIPSSNTRSICDIQYTYTVIYSAHR